MDKNQFAGLILMLVLLTVYFTFFAPDPVQPTPEVDGTTSSIEVDTTSSPSAMTDAAIEAPSDSVANKLKELKYGLFSSVASGQERPFSLETNTLRVDFSNKGGSIQTVELKEFEAHNGGPLLLKDAKNSEIDIYFEHLSRRINLADLYFSQSQKDLGDSTEVRFSLAITADQSLDLIYTLFDEGYEIGFRMESKGFEKAIDAKNIDFFWKSKLNRLERDLTDSRNRTTVRYRSMEGDVDYLDATSKGHEEKSLSSNINWVAFKRKFFTSAIIAKKSFQSLFITSDVNEADTAFSKYVTMQMEIPFTDIAANQALFKFYFGPNRYKSLDAVAPSFSENINLGWSVLSVVNKYLIIPIFRFLEGFIPNYGIIIIVMVLVIRLLLSPLTYRSHISMAKMRVLKPELDAIKEKHDGDMQKAQSEQMELYRKVGINPLSGCIPVVLQFPILVSLFYFIPAAIEFRLESFLWSSDLSTYDSILTLPFNIPFYGDHVSLFTLLMAGSTILYTMANSQMTSVQGPMKTMQYIMPVMLLFFFNSYPSGLSYYYFVTNLVSFGQIALFRKFIDESKIKAILDENKKKNANKKKSKFQQRLEDAMKANQAAQKKQKKK
ncbi:MAG: membrane protein insertase YidC [Cyclobacteriaceae bacterium]|nr:membrane protein insertase YidC [Cyclobacteriaceae bacterium HetDA_MAG_MS6]